MPTAYSPLLGLALPVTGELAGTWGDTVNNYITTYLDSSVAGTQTISGSQTAVTLSVTNGTTLVQVGSGSSGSAQYSIINCTGNPAATLVIDAPKASKTYVVNNATSTNQSVTLRGGPTTPTSGVTLVAGEKAVVAWNGSDFIKVATSAVDGVSTISFGSTGLTPSTATSGAVTVAGTLVAANGGTGQSSYTTGDLLYATGSTALSKLGIGTNGQILTSTGTAPQWSTLSGVAVTTFSAGTTGFTPSSATSGAVTLAGTLATTNGGTGLTSFTANGVVYASSTSALTTGSALTWNGSTLLVGGNTRFGSGAVIPGFATASDASLANNASLRGTNAAGSTAFELIKLNTSDQVVINNDGADAVLTVATTSQRWIIGGEQMRLTSTGLGIGTSSPAYKLDVAGSVIRLINSGATADLFLTDSGTTNGYVRLRGESNALKFITGNGISATLDSSGNLGLGVTPSASWDSIFKAIQIGSASYLSIAAQTTATARGSILWNAVGSGDESFVYRNTGDPANRFMVGSGFYAWYTAPSGTAGNAISFSQVMTLDASGNLGIGTSSPTQRLSVAAASALVDITSTTGTSFNGVELKNTSGSFYIGQDNSAGSFYGSNSAYARSLYATGAYPMVFFTNATERMRLDSSGNLGIGTSSPAAKLDVQGGNTRLLREGAVLQFATYAYSSTQSFHDARWTAWRARGTAASPSVVQAGDELAAWEISGWNANNDWTYVGGIRAYATGTITGSNVPSYLTLETSNGSSGIERVRISNDGTFRVKGAGTAGSTDAVQFAGSAPASAMSLDSSGNLLVGRTSQLVGIGKSITLSDGTNSCEFNADRIYFNASNYYVLDTTATGVKLANGATAWAAQSDERLKDIIEPIENAANKVLSLRAVIGKYKSDKDGVRRSFLIAQDVQKVLPEVIDIGKLPATDDETEYLSIRYTEVIPLLVAAIKEQQVIITELRQRVAALEAK